MGKNIQSSNAVSGSEYISRLAPFAVTAATLLAGNEALAQTANATNAEIAMIVPKNDTTPDLKKDSNTTPTPDKKSEEPHKEHPDHGHFTILATGNPLHNEWGGEITYAHPIPFKLPALSGHMAIPAMVAFSMISQLDPKHEKEHPRTSLPDPQSRAEVKLGTGVEYSENIGPITLTIPVIIGPSLNYHTNSDNSETRAGIFALSAVEISTPIRHYASLVVGVAGSLNAIPQDKNIPFNKMIFPGFELGIGARF